MSGLYFIFISVAAFLTIESPGMRQLISPPAFADRFSFSRMGLCFKIIPLYPQKLGIHNV
jgi:hypothetical protein